MVVVSSAPAVSALYIHTSDRISFKRCRRRWVWGSHLGGNLKPKQTARPLTFGTAIHAALEVYYNPETWHLVVNPDTRVAVEALTMAAFEKSMNDTRIKFLVQNEQEALNEEEQADHDEHMKLGKGMLHGYFLWAPLADEYITPVAVELDFVVPIGNPPMEVDGTPVMYRGRIDLLVRDRDGKYWIWDHKTTARLEDAVSHLELDEQLGSYAWALEQQLGIKIEGCVYNELYKGFPEPPAMNKVQRMGRWFSINKMQDTSYGIYLATVKEQDRAAWEEGLYDEFLRWLKTSGRQWFRRTQVHRTRHELAEMGQRIEMETMDMLDPNLRIYPSPSRFSCQWCQFRLPCLAMNDGSDVAWILEENYVQGDYSDPSNPFTGELD